MDTVGYIFIIIGLLFVTLGTVGIFRFDNFYSRALSSADIDTIGLITILVGVAILNGLSWFTLKIFVVLVVLLLLNPIVTSSIVNSAYMSGLTLKEVPQKDD